ncbi:hypothetical protein ACO0LF_12345 [Undibacterium sp. Di27W]|uniref:hypothetical protein n=1 Tax=Undibacterium sp. Di27W TaxID=3413036 RepID=UPI003BF25BC8
MPITKEQWKEIEGQLSLTWGSVDLKIDGYNINLRVEPQKARTYAVMVYLDYKFEWKWAFDGTEEAKRFCRTVSKFMFKPKERAVMVKMHGGKRCPKAELEQINRKFYFYSPLWSSVPAMRRHFEKNNHSLEVINIGYAP